MKRGALVFILLVAILLIWLASTIFTPVQRTTPAETETSQPVDEPPKHDPL